MNTPSNSAIGSAGMASTASGGVLSAFGAISSGVANSSMFNYQASVAKLNQQIDAQDAEFSMEAGREQNEISGLKAGQQQGQIIASQSSSGFDVRSGSAKQVQASQTMTERTDSDLIRSNAAKTAYNYEVQGTIAGAQATAYKAAAGNALTAGFIGAGSSILGASASVSSEWLQGQRVGLWGGGTGSQTYGGGTDVFGGAQ